MVFQGDRTCAICYEDFKDSDEIVQLPCASTHIYHYACLDNWIEFAQKRNEEPNCPLCRSHIQLE